MADPEASGLWRDLRLGYTESQGHPLLRAEAALGRDAGAHARIGMAKVGDEPLLQPFDRDVGEGRERGVEGRGDGQHSAALVDAVEAAVGHLHLLGGGVDAVRGGDEGGALGADVAVLHRAPGLDQLRGHRAAAEGPRLPVGESVQRGGGPIPDLYK